MLKKYFMSSPSVSVLRLVLVLTLLIASLSASARKLSGRVVDAATGRTISYATVELLSVDDSSLVATAIVKTDTLWNDEVYSYYNIKNVQNNTDYILRASAVGYETAYKRVKVRMGERVAQQWIGDIQLKENTTMLDELRRQGYRQASLAVQKANYAVRMYLSVGFEIIDENEEEYIMLCRLN